MLPPGEPPAPPPKPNAVTEQPGPDRVDGEQASRQSRAISVAQPQVVADPGDNWLPKMLEHKAKSDIADLLGNAALMAAFSEATLTAPPSTAAAQVPLRDTLRENMELAAHLNDVEARLAAHRSDVQAQLLSMHALERQWRQKQADMDRALAPSAPASLYRQLAQGVQEQELVCRALEQTFLDGDGDVATEREVGDWVRRFREAKQTYYNRREQKERWDEGRVGGWR